jgi:DNA-binding NtrC family response regulator
MTQDTPIHEQRSGPLAGAHIYVVDDEPLMAEVVAKKLALEGANPEVFNDSKAAWNAFLTAQPRPILLVTDFLMKSLNGLELIERCKKAEPNLKTVLYSGSIGMEVASRFTQKPDHFLPKPFDLEYLAKTVRLLLSA